MSDVALAGDSTEAEAFAETLIARGAIGEDDVLRLRREVFTDGLVAPGEAAMLFRLDQGCADKAAGWTDFYVEALTDHFVHRAEPRGYVDEALADRLLDELARDGRIAHASELELLVNVLDRAVSCPERLALAALEAIRRSIVAPEQAVYGEGRRPGVIEDLDVTLLSRVIYAGAGLGSVSVSRAEADQLFALNRDSDEAANAASWRALFVKAVGSHLMAPRVAAAPLDAAEQARREAWLEERRSRGEGLLRIGRGMLDTLRGFDAAGRLGEAWATLDPTGRRRREDAAAEAEAAAREAARRRRIDAAEAAWLIERLDADGKISANERALLAFVKDTAAGIDPALQAVMDKAGI